MKELHPVTKNPAVAVYDFHSVPGQLERKSLYSGINGLSSTNSNIFKSDAKGTTWDLYFPVFK